MALDLKEMAAAKVVDVKQASVVGPVKQAAAPSAPARGMVRLMNVASGQLVDMTEDHAKQFVDSPYWRVIV